MKRILTVTRILRSKKHACMERLTQVPMESRGNMTALSAVFGTVYAAVEQIARNMKQYVAIIAIVFLGMFACKSTSISHDPSRNETPDRENLERFEARVEKLRRKHHIPSLSVGIVFHRELQYYKGFGFADIAEKAVPDAHTIYHLASVTKTFAAIILMQLVEEGKMSLDDPVTKYNIPLYGRWGGDDRIKIRHLMTHTAQGHTFNGFKPGYSFRYNGDFFGQLVFAIEKSSGQNFASLMEDRIVKPLSLEHTIPNVRDSVSFLNHQNIVSQIAKGYDWDNKRLVAVTDPDYFGPAAGLMSCVADLAKYSNAIDDGMFLSDSSWQVMHSHTVTPNGKVIPYGLGWFVKDYDGMKVLWHTGWWTGNSALFVKIPEKGVTLIMLANSQDLSRPFYPKVNPFNPKLGKDLLKSAFAKAFFDEILKH